MAEPVPRLPQAASKSASDNLFITREELDSTRTTELVLAKARSAQGERNKRR